MSTETRVILEEEVMRYSLAMARKLKNETKDFKSVELSSLAAGLSTTIKLMIQKDLFRLDVELKPMDPKTKTND